MRTFFVRFTYLTLLALPMFGCSNGSNNNDGEQGSAVEPVAADEQSVFAVANGCYAISPDDGQRFLAASPEDLSALTDDGPTLVGTFNLEATTAADAAHFLLRPSDLGKYLLFDAGERYMVSDGQSLQRQSALMSDVTEVDGKVVIDSDMQSEGEWQLLAAPDARFMLQHIKSGNYIGADGTMVAEADAADLMLVEAEACAEFPELSLDATGEIAVTEFDDGSVFGFVETHAHLFTNLAFGGGGVFHGAPFHPLGVEHALHDCDITHGIDGRKDVMGAGFSDGDIEALLPAVFTGQLPEKNHNTDGYPTFTDWPNAPSSSTHQTQYYKWLERAYLSGMRLLVQHATTNEFLCKLTVGIGSQVKRHDCNDMVNVDAILDATFAMERYIDALSGGPGEGWFRIVYSPEEAREEIVAGNLAVVLGIETSVLFDCYLVPPEGFSKCTEADVIAKLDEYHAKGVRVLFPVHKYDNGFSAGDGHRGIIDIGNFGHTGHFNNYIECPAELLTFPGGFDTGGLAFADLNQPRDVYDSTPPIDTSGFEENVVGTLLPHLGKITSGPLAGEYCQNHGLTDLGEFLMAEMMKRGMIIEVDHMPRKSYKRAYEILEENDYPAMGTHGRHNNGRLYKLGGMSKFNFGRCRSADETATMDDGFQERIQLMREMGTFPAEGFGFDFNGFAGAPRARFGDNARCSSPQTDEGITYPFKSYAGDVTLQQPVVGERTLDFNTEGMVHLGLVAELIEDVRRDGVTDEELEPLFKSAEGYIRVWEKSERRASEIVQQSP
jgi:microsomal dipeptidase-like Zn-dependent dipeptidase